MARGLPSRLLASPGDQPEVVRQTGLNWGGLFPAAPTGRTPPWVPARAPGAAGPDRAAAALLCNAAKHFSVLFFARKKITVSFSAPPEHPTAQLLGLPVPSWDVRSRRPGGSRWLLSHQTTNVTSVSQFVVTDGYRDGDTSATGAGFSSATAAPSVETCRDGHGVRCSVGPPREERGAGGSDALPPFG